jgi:hypothetical protein
MFTIPSHGWFMAFFYPHYRMTWDKLGIPRLLVVLQGSPSSATIDDGGHTGVSVDVDTGPAVAGRWPVYWTSLGFSRDEHEKTQLPSSHSHSELMGANPLVCWCLTIPTYPIPTSPHFEFERAVPIDPPHGRVYLDLWKQDNLKAYSLAS